MSDERQCAAEPLTWKIKIRRAYGEAKHSVYMKWHAFYWRALHLTGLARPYSIMMCNLRLYRTFRDGRCQWCGIIHNRPLCEFCKKKEYTHVEFATEAGFLLCDDCRQKT